MEVFIPSPPNDREEDIVRIRRRSATEVDRCDTHLTAVGSKADLEKWPEHVQFPVVSVAFPDVKRNLSPYEIVLSLGFVGIERPHHFERLVVGTRLTVKEGPQMNRLASLITGGAATEEGYYGKNDGLDGSLRHGPFSPTNRS